MIRRRLLDKVAAAYLLDRAEQFSLSSGTRCLLEDIAAKLADGEHRVAFAHGELDDLVKHFTRKPRLSA